ncbi:hypothetical protein ACFXCR_33825 [Streptomyces sp. NPDC059431]|uniref:hypothetical protein n=1 Tax=Streptomyces sp. NPDC059431 TaxID=3346828 RepID=UPI00369F69BE
MVEAQVLAAQQGRAQGLDPGSGRVGAAHQVVRQGAQPERGFALLGPLGEFGGAAVVECGALGRAEALVGLGQRRVVGHAVPVDVRAGRLRTGGRRYGVCAPRPRRVRGQRVRERERGEAGRVQQPGRPRAEHEGEQLGRDPAQGGRQELLVGDVRVLDVLHHQGARAARRVGEGGEQEVHDAVGDAQGVQAGRVAAHLPGGRLLLDVVGDRRYQRGQFGRALLELDVVPGRQGGPPLQRLGGQQPQQGSGGGVRAAQAPVRVHGGEQRGQAEAGRQRLALVTVWRGDPVVPAHR